MSPIAPEVWARLEQGRPVGDNLTARQAASASRLQCALDSEGRRHLLIALQDKEEELRDIQSRGIHVETRDLIVRGQPAARYLDMQCLDATGFPALDLIGGELVTELLKPDAVPAAIVKRVLAKWRRFWGLLPRTMLSREEIVGLFAELWFFLVWLLPAAGPVAASERWRGPMGSRHDYEWPGTSVEVKASTSTRGRIHRINGLDQLSPPQDGVLYFFSLLLREEAGATNTLPALIATIAAKLNTEEEALSRFETTLAQTGYSPIHDDEYSKHHLRIAAEGLYAVKDDFPRLNTDQFQTAIPPGIERVEYEINLNAHDHLKIAGSPGEAAAKLRG